MPFLLLAALFLVRPFAAGSARSADLQVRRDASRPEGAGFEGIWNSATATPLERPLQLKDKAFFTAQEAAAWERQFADNNEEPSPQAASKNTGTGTYNTVYREFGTRVVKTLRTSIVTDPADGRIPALSPEAAERKRRRVEAM